MKVTREEGFKPITIVLETKDEADAMWYHLNVGDNYIKEGNQYKGEINIKEGANIFYKFAKVHTP